MKCIRKFSIAAAALALAAVMPAIGTVDTSGLIGPAHAVQNETDHRGATYTHKEIVSRGHQFFGSTTKGLAQAVEHVFAEAGRPRGYIIGEEGAGAFVGGLRYGEGTLYIKDGPQQKVFWQGPSVGFDFGGNGSRTLVLIYDIDTPHDIFDRFVGVEGSAYLVGGFGVNFQSNEKTQTGTHPDRRGCPARRQCRLSEIHQRADLEPVLTDIEQRAAPTIECRRGLSW